MVASLRFNSALNEPTRVCGTVARHRAHLGAVAADRRELQRGEDQVDIVKRPAADQRHRAAGQLLQAAERMPQRRRHPDLLRRRRDIEDGAVDVEQDRAFPQVGSERGVRDFHVQVRNVALSVHVCIQSVDK